MSNVDCNKMAEIASSGFLRFSLIFNLIITICAVPVLIRGTWKLWSMKYTKLFHVNFKIIIQLHLFGFMLHCSGRIFLHSIDLFNYTTQDNPCDMVPNIYRCFVLRLMYNTGLWITNSTAVSLIIERCLATKRRATYEKESVKMGICLVFFQFAITSIPLCILYSKVQFEGVVMYLCVTAQANIPYVGQISAVVGFMFQLSTRISFHYLYKQNKRCRHNEVHHSTLSKRYQLEQNISSIHCLKTFAGVSTMFIVMSNVIYIILMFHAKNLNPYQYFAPEVGAAPEVRSTAGYLNNCFIKVHESDPKSGRNAINCSFKNSESAVPG